jgi:hypothetical protein
MGAVVNSTNTDFSTAFKNWISANGYSPYFDNLFPIARFDNLGASGGGPRFIMDGWDCSGVVFALNNGGFDPVFTHCLFGGTSNATGWMDQGPGYACIINAGAGGITVRYCTMDMGGRRTLTIHNMQQMISAWASPGHDVTLEYNWFLGSVAQINSLGTDVGGGNVYMRYNFHDEVYPGWSQSTPQTIASATNSGVNFQVTATGPVTTGTGAEVQTGGQIVIDRSNIAAMNGIWVVTHLGSPNFTYVLQSSTFQSGYTANSAQVAGDFDHMNYLQFVQDPNVSGTPPCVVHDEFRFNTSMQVQTLNGAEGIQFELTPDARDIQISPKITNNTMICKPPASMSLFIHGPVHSTGVHDPQQVTGSPECRENYFDSTASGVFSTDDPTTPKWPAWNQGAGNFLMPDGSIIRLPGT